MMYRRWVTRHRASVSVGDGDLHDNSGGISSLMGNRHMYTLYNWFKCAYRYGRIYCIYIYMVHRRKLKIENILTVGRQRFIGEHRAKVHIYLHKTRAYYIINIYLYPYTGSFVIYYDAKFGRPCTYTWHIIIIIYIIYSRERVAWPRLIFTVRARKS